MRPSELEFWALEVIERVNKRQPVEDDRVELKAQWVDPARAARRIAGHANAAHGEPILWLIGVDETRGVLGAKDEELSTWFSQVSCQFDGTPPALSHANIPTTNGTVVALLFETDRAPFVVKRPAGAQVDLEVPWREATSIRSARRADLLRLLVPVQRLPDCDIMQSALTATDTTPDEVVDWRLDVQLYITPRTAESLVFPLHRCQVALSVPSWEIADLQMQAAFSASGASRTVAATNTEAIVEGPGSLGLAAAVQTKGPSRQDVRGPATSRMLLRPVGTDAAARVEAALAYDRQTKLYQSGRHIRWETRWRLSVS
jgi:hypothetical protein